MFFLGLALPCVLLGGAAAVRFGCLDVSVSVRFGSFGHLCACVRVFCVVLLGILCAAHVFLVGLGLDCLVLVLAAAVRCSIMLCLS
jgi:hypothetical protein